MLTSARHGLAPFGLLRMLGQRVTVMALLLVCGANAFRLTIESREGDAKRCFRW